MKQKSTIHKAFMAYMKGKIDIAELYSIVMFEYKGRDKKDKTK